MLKIRSVSGDAPVQEFFDYLVSCPNSLVYATPRFIALVSQHLGAEGGWLEARRNGCLVGLLPFVSKQGFLGPVFNSLAYYGSNGGVVQLDDDVEAKSGLIEHFYTMAQKAGGVSATIITNPLEEDSSFYFKHANHDLLDERIGLITHFPANADAEVLVKSFEDPRPRNIRRAVRDGITVQRRQDADALNFLYDTHSDNMRAIGGLPKKRSFFDAIPREMREGEWSIHVGNKDGQPVAALLTFYFNRTVEYFTPVIREEFRSTQALSLIIYQAMQDSIQRGFFNWNWGGTWLVQDGVYDFKKRWGTTQYSYYYFTRIFNAEVRSQTKQAVLDAYEGFYVLPFSELTAV
ncbi:MAG: GNAT family N-acetyltransferase [Pseudomonadota bacterium]